MSPAKPRSCSPRFNPPPAHPPEETSLCWGRSPAARFQPASGSSAGGNAQPPRDDAAKQEFQPASGSSAGGNDHVRVPRLRDPLFQPASGSSAGGNAPRRGRFGGRCRFQPASGSSAGGNLIAGHVRTAGGPFQPASGSSAGGNSRRPGSTARATSFQPASGSSAGGNVPRPACHSGRGAFQPASGSSAGGNGTSLDTWGGLRRVSTRLRLIRRRKRRAEEGRETVRCFNPPPAHPPEETAGRCRRPHALPASFNPPPAHPPEETVWAARQPAASAVSTRLRLIRRRKHYVVRPVAPAPDGVSTRLRLIRRRKPPRAPQHPPNLMRFNPPPAHPPEETGSGRQRAARPRRFNPPPAHPPEETVNSAMQHVMLLVSTRLRLIRRRKRARHGRDRRLPPVSTRLRLIRRRKPRRRCRADRHPGTFQPASGSSAGGNIVAILAAALLGLFQPASGSSAGGNDFVEREYLVELKVSTRLRLIRRRKRKPSRQLVTAGLFQPASGSSAGGNSPSTPLSGASSGFNPPPAHPPEETRGCTAPRGTHSVSTRLRLIRRRKLRRPRYRSSGA